MNDNPQEERQKVYDYCRTMLADGMIDVELDPIHYETALNRTLAKFRQRSSNSVEESYAFLTLEKDKNDYKLGEEIINVQSVFRRTLGSRTGGGTGTNFEPFNLAYTNTYLLNSTMLGGLATYYLFASYQEMVGKIFGSYIEFQWIPYSRTLRILQRPFTEGEVIMLRCQNFRPDFVLLNDLYAKQWILDYTLANCKIILGEARSKFANIAGPQGGGQLNGGDLKSAGKEEIEKLEKELFDLIPGGTGYTFIIG
ncbi:hypothetical protein EB118_00135 [bacterium]|nr:hypothetical protein [bacterium]